MQKFGKDGTSDSSGDAAECKCRCVWIRETKTLIRGKYWSCSICEDEMAQLNRKIVKWRPSRPRMRHLHEALFQDPLYSKSECTA
jgi:hypothetical protein